MEFLIVTNNDGELLDYLSGLCDRIETIEIEGNIRDVAFAARDYVMGDYVLVADPLAGRLERPTPYLTVILKKVDVKKEEVISKDILRIENFVKFYCANEEALNTLSPQYKKDFREIDTSLTKGCCTQMLMGK